MQMIDLLFIYVNNKRMDDKTINSLWSHIHCLMVLHQQGSYTRTAQYLGLSKAAISQRISELEKQIGVALVQRTTRSVQLSDAGKRLAEQAKLSFSDLRQGVAQLQDLLDQATGLIRVTLPVALARQQIVPRLEAFLNRYPDIQIELHLSDQLLTLEHEGFDLAIRHTASPPENYIAWSLCTTQTHLVASPRYLDQHGIPTQPSDLSQHRCLCYPRPKGLSSWTLEHRQHSAQSITVPIHPSFSANNSEVLRDIALQHQGIALLPDFSVQDNLERGNLVEVLPDWRNLGIFGDQIYALRPYSPHVPQAVRLFVDYLRASMAKGFSSNP